ncbi:MAG: hypothetical protein AB1938_08145 [Myxococcota bacterium]
MGIPIGSTYTSTVEATFLRHFTCKHCGFESVAKVRSKGEGQGTSPLWLREEGAKSAASKEALSRAEGAADELVSMAECPSCERHDERARSSAQTSAWLGGVGLGAVCAVLCYFVFSTSHHAVAISAVAAVIAAALHVKHRAWRWTEVDERVQVLTHAELEALVEAHGLDEEEVEAA